MCRQNSNFGCFYGDKVGVVWLDNPCPEEGELAGAEGEVAESTKLYIVSWSRWVAGSMIRVDAPKEFRISYWFPIASSAWNPAGPRRGIALWYQLSGVRETTSCHSQPSF